MYSVVLIDSMGESCWCLPAFSWAIIVSCLKFTYLFDFGHIFVKRVAEASSAVRLCSAQGSLHLARTMTL